jgi:hypothetical protein
LDCFTKGSIFFGLLKKETLPSMILTFDKKKFIQVQWYFYFFEYIMVGDWYFLCLTYHIWWFFSLSDFCWVKKKMWWKWKFVGNG